MVISLALGYTLWKPLKGSFRARSCSNPFRQTLAGVPGELSGPPSGQSFNFGRRLSLARDLAGDSSGRLLDCACGTGEITCALLESGRFQRATIVDLSPRMLEQTKALIAGKMPGLSARFVHSDIFSFYPDVNEQGYDLIVCLGLIAHVGRLDELVAHLRTMLSSNGRILLQTTLADHLGTKVIRTLTARWYASRHGYAISYFRHTDIAAAAARAGLQIVAMRRHNVGVPFADRLSPDLNHRLEVRLRSWAARYGADAIYVLGAASPSEL
jgi:2-polyprenyl-3-methyl-5-hydroxy-6-metoxy-1,4-benzoquinol methylase